MNPSNVDWYLLVYNVFVKDFFISWFIVTSFASPFLNNHAHVKNISLFLVIRDLTKKGKNGICRCDKNYERL